MLTRMAARTDPTDPAEPDLYWAGHSGWAMLPGFVVGLVLSVVVMFGLTSAGDLVNLNPETTAFIRFWVVLIGWVVAGVVWAYRGSSFVYRLTPQHLFVDFGLVYRPVPPIPLDEIEGIESRAWALRRLFGVGAVIVKAKDRPPVVMSGIFRPPQFVAAIRRAMKKGDG
jgi:membrane protein YdbS with pleckstrin-like domain